MMALHRMPALRWLGHAVAGSLLALTAGAAAAGNDDWGVCTFGVRVTCVADGDTVWFRGEKLRLFGTDAPERFSRAACDRERALAEASTARLAGLLASGEVTVEPHGVDDYGRTLAVVAVDRRDVGAVLIAEGLAVRRTEAGADDGWCR